MNASVSGITCMSPRPPSQLTMSDCQPLSCQAVASTSRLGTVSLGAEVGQYFFPAAVRNAALALALATFLPSRCAHSGSWKLFGSSVGVAFGLALLFEGLGFAVVGSGL